MYHMTATNSWLKNSSLEENCPYGYEWLGNESVEKGESNIASFPTGNQTVPAAESGWDYDMAKGRQDQSHFVRNQAGTW